MTLTELVTPIAQVHIGDIVIEHDWRLHVTGTGTDQTGAYVTVSEFGTDHLHLGDALSIDITGLPA